MFTKGEYASLAYLVEQEIMRQPSAARIEGRPVAPGQYAAALGTMLRKLKAALGFPVHGLEGQVE